MPGGVDVLIAFQLLIENEFRELDMPLAISDVDLENFFCKVEWSAIRSACDKHFPALTYWLRWKHSGRSTVQLPGGTDH